MNFRLSICFLIIMWLMHCNYVAAQTTHEYNRIIDKFEFWKTQQFKSGKFATDKNCVPDTVVKDNYKGADMGIPKELDISFTDINQDGKIDGLITFHPDQCDGGNALMNVQIRILVLSTSNDYITDDTFVDNIEQAYDQGWLMIEKASENVLYGVYYNYKKGDGHCCPGIRKPFELNYLTKELTFTNK